MKIDDLDARRIKRIEKALAEHVHPASQDHKVWPDIALQQLLRQGGIISVPRFLYLHGVFLPLGLETVRDQIEVLPGDACLIRSRCCICLGPIHIEADNLGIRDPAGGNSIDESLEIRAIPTGHHHDAAGVRHDALSSGIEEKYR